MRFFLCGFCKNKILEAGRFFFIIFLATSCNSARNQKSLSALLNREEKKDLDYFFRNLMIHQSGVFVLFGSKPLCTAGFLEDVAQRKGGPYRRDLMKGWEAWKKIKKQLNGTRFIIFKKTVPMSLEWPDRRKDERILHHVVLIDIQKTALVLAKNYEVFRALTEIDFHPLEIVFEVENPDSVFWNKIFYAIKNDQSRTAPIHSALGLLFGFGEDSVLFFRWRQEAREKKGKASEFFNKYEFLPSQGCEERYYSFEEVFDSGIEALMVPGFAMIEGDDMNERYKNEKNMILDIYRGKDFLETTLQRLAK